MPTPQPSAVSNLIIQATTKSPRESLAIEVLHNLQHQHHWTDLKLFAVSSPSSNSGRSTPTQSPTRARSRSKSPNSARDTIFLISGLPPRHMYIHPDLQKQLVEHDISNDDMAVQREWVLPVSTGEKWTLKQFCWVFFGLPGREEVSLRSDVEGKEPVKWRDGKRVVLGMLAHNGLGGDGTVAYYIMQEGEVKPRQNG